jgi:xanthine dehydrogenase small subunit
MAIRDHLVLFVNGKRREVHGSDCFLSLSDFLRYRLGLTGTKIVCSEGDCGSCTVLVGRADGTRTPALSQGARERLRRYKPIDSCIRLMFQLDGCQVVTIEGLTGESGNGNLTSIQQAMVDCHGSQCGFCTPGFVMAMTGTCEGMNDRHLTEEDWQHALTGNLCRCTGYTPILKAAMQAASEVNAKLNGLYPPRARLKEMEALAEDTLDLRGECSMKRRAYCPTSLDGAVAFRRDHPDAKIVAGATDVGVQLNKRAIEPTVFLDLNRVEELEGAELVASDDSGQMIVAGARSTWTEVLELCREAVPEFAEIISIFGSPQIRHVGTIGGNIINASPIADSLPFLMVMEAELELAGSAGRRTVNINDFYKGYKEFDLRPDELLAKVHVPLSASDDLLRLYRVSRRRDLDIATFTAAIRMRLDGDIIAAAALAHGAVGPTVIRLRRTEEFLLGRPFSEETMRDAGDIAVEEISPISDVRGSRDYRYQLARNVLSKFYHQQQLAVV